MVAKVVEDIHIRIGKLQDQLRKIQDTCSHPNIKVKFGGSTGNWCPDDDCHWMDVECVDCGWKKCFYDDQPEYNTFYRTRNVVEE